MWVSQFVGFVSRSAPLDVRAPIFIAILCRTQGLRPSWNIAVMEYWNDGSTGGKTLI